MKTGTPPIWPGRPSGKLDASRTVMHGKLVDGLAVRFAEPDADAGDAVKCQHVPLGVLHRLDHVVWNVHSHLRNGNWYT